MYILRVKENFHMAGNMKIPIPIWFIRRIHSKPFQEILYLLKTKKKNVFTLYNI